MGEEELAEISEEMEVAVWGFDQEEELIGDQGANNL